MSTCPSSGTSAGTVLCDDAQDLHLIVGGGLLVTMDSGLRLLDPGWLRIEGPYIREVGNEPLVPTQDEEVLETSGMVVLPGFVNTHTHLFQTLLRAVYDQQPLSTYLSKIYGCGLELTYEDCRIAALAGSAEAIRSGVTTLVDHHFLNRRNDLVTGTIDGLLASGVRAGCRSHGHGHRRRAA